MRSRQISAASPRSCRQTPATAEHLSKHRRPTWGGWRPATSMLMWRPAGPEPPLPARSRPPPRRPQRSRPDEDHDGRYDVLLVETRGFKGPRNYDVSGTPLHRDNQSIKRERMYLDKSDPDILHDEITIIDHALTRPWTVTKNYRRAQSKQPIWWHEDICAEANVHVDIGGQAHFLSPDGLLIPPKKEQPPPGMRHLEQTRRS